jgi:hypothetical protein
VVCVRYGVPLVAELPALVQAVRSRINSEPGTVAGVGRDPGS